MNNTEQNKPNRFLSTLAGVGLGMVGGKLVGNKINSRLAKTFHSKTMATLGSGNIDTDELMSMINSFNRKAKIINHASNLGGGIAGGLAGNAIHRKFQRVPPTLEKDR